jgi:hypothetical protein
MNETLNRSMALFDAAGLAAAPHGRSHSLLYHQHFALRTEILLRRHPSDEATLLDHIRRLADHPLGQHPELA